MVIEALVVRQDLERASQALARGRPEAPRVGAHSAPATLMRRVKRYARLLAPMSFGLETRRPRRRRTDGDEGRARRRLPRRPDV